MLLPSPIHSLEARVWPGSASCVSNSNNQPFTAESDISYFSMATSKLDERAFRTGSSECSSIYTRPRWYSIRHDHKSFRWESGTEVGGN